MKRFMLVLALIGLAVGVAFALDIKIGYFDNPPHIFMGKTKVEGVLVDYWEKYAAPSMGITVEWVGPLPPARLFSMLQSGEINSIALLSKNPEREKLYDYPEKPFQDVSAGVAVLHETAASITSIDSLRGLRISFYKDGFISPKLKAVDIKWDFLTATDWKVQGLEKLAAKRVDGVYDPDSTTLIYAVKSNKKFAGLMETVPLKGTESANYSLFSKKDNGAFLKLYNQFRRATRIKYPDMLADYLSKQ